MKYPLDEIKYYYSLGWKYEDIGDKVSYSHQKIARIIRYFKIASKIKRSPVRLEDTDGFDLLYNIYIDYVTDENSLSKLT